MSFSEDVRAELAGIAPARECDRLAELSALFHFAGRLHLLGRGEVSLHLDLSSAAVARRAFTILRELGVRSEIRTYQRHAFGRETRYQLHVEGGQATLEVLQQAGVVVALALARQQTVRLAEGLQELLAHPFTAEAAPALRRGRDLVRAHPQRVALERHRDAAHLRQRIQ